MGYFFVARACALGVPLNLTIRPLVDQGAAARSSNQRIAKTSSLASFAMRRHPAAEKISSIQNAGNAILQNLHNPKMVDTFSASNKSLRPKASLFLSALEAPGKGIKAGFEAKDVFTTAECGRGWSRFERSSSAPCAQISSVAATSHQPDDGQTISTENHTHGALRGDQPAPLLCAHVARDSDISDPHEVFDAFGGLLLLLNWIR